MKDFAVGIPTMLGDAWGAGMQNMREGWNGFWQDAKNTFFQSITAMLAELARAQLIKGLTSLFGSLLGGIGGGGATLSSGTASNIGFHGVYTPKPFADGGVPPMNRVSVVGENGPELFVPSERGRILSHSDSKKALAGNGGTGTFIIQNHFHADRQTGMFNKASAQQAARDTSDYLQRLQRR